MSPVSIYPQFRTESKTVWCVFRGQTLVSIHDNRGEAEDAVAAGNARHWTPRYYCEEWDIA